MAKHKELERLATFIRLARTARDMSQRDLADRIGKSQNYVFLVETGGKDVGIMSLKHIATALALPLKSFLEAMEEKSS